MRNTEKMAAGLMGMFSPPTPKSGKSERMSVKKENTSKKKFVGRPAKGQQKFVPEGGWIPQTLWISGEHFDKIHNLSEILGISIRDTVYQLLSRSIEQYEKKNDCNLLDKPETKSVF